MEQIFVGVYPKFWHYRQNRLICILWMIVLLLTVGKKISTTKIVPVACIFMSKLVYRMTQLKWADKWWLDCLQRPSLCNTGLFYASPPRHLLGSHTVLGISVPGVGGHVGELRFIYGLFISYKSYYPGPNTVSFGIILTYFWTIKERLTTAKNQRLAKFLFAKDFVVLCSEVSDPICLLLTYHLKN